MTVARPHPTTRVARTRSGQLVSVPGGNSWTLGATLSCTWVAGEEGARTRCSGSRAASRPTGIHFTPATGSVTNARTGSSYRPDARGLVGSAVLEPGYFPAYRAVERARCRWLDGIAGF